MTTYIAQEILTAKVDRASEIAKIIVGLQSENGRIDILAENLMGGRRPEYPIGSRLVCDSTHKTFEQDVESKQWIEVQKEVGLCILVEYNPFKSYGEYTVSFVAHDSEGNEVAKTDNVSIYRLRLQTDEELKEVQEGYDAILTPVETDEKEGGDNE